jgi:hypothetical protein
MGQIGLIKSSFTMFIPCRHIPIGNGWKSIARDDFGQFRGNIKYTHRLALLSSLPPLDMMYVDDAPNLLDVPDVLNVIDVLDVTDATDETNILDTTNVPDVTNISDDSSDLSSTSDISQVRITEEMLVVHHYVDMEYDTNDTTVIRIVIHELRGMGSFRGS